MSLSELPLAAGQKHRKVLERKFGFDCRKNGEPIVLVGPSGQLVSIPNHAEMKKPTLRRSGRPSTKPELLSFIALLVPNKSPGPHHVALRMPDFQAVIARLESTGMRLPGKTP